MKRVVFIVVLLFCLNSVKAAEITYVKKEATPVFSTKTMSNGKRIRAQLFYLYVNNEIAYCIEPGVALHDIVYESTNDFHALGISDEIRKELELIAYYGYAYEGHQNQYYYMATQQLIWEKMGARDVVWDAGNGDLLNIDTYKTEILSLVGNHDLLPSFANKKVTVKVGEEYTLIDDNKVFHKFEGESLDTQNNSLVLKSDKEESKTYTFYQKRKGNISLAYFANASQKVATFHLSDNQMRSFSFTVEFLKEKGNILLTKKDGSTGFPLKGAVFGLYDENYVLIEKQTSNQDGLIVWKEIPYGIYFIREEESPKGYVLLDEDIKIKLSKAEETVEVSNQPTEMPVTNDIDFLYRKSAFAFLGIGIVLWYAFKKVSKG